MKVKERRRRRKAEAMRKKILEEAFPKAKTIKLKVARNGRLDGRWETAKQAVAEINVLAREGHPYKVHDVDKAHLLKSKYDLLVGGRQPDYPTTVPLLGYYIKAELTDIGEAWVRFVKAEDVTL